MVHATITPTSSIRRSSSCYPHFNTAIASSYLLGFWPCTNLLVPMKVRLRSKPIDWSLAVPNVSSKCESSKTNRKGSFCQQVCLQRCGLVLLWLWSRWPFENVVSDATSLVNFCVVGIVTLKIVDGESCVCIQTTRLDELCFWGSSFFECKTETRLAV